MVRWLVAIGIVLILLGLLWPWLARLGLGRLPEDFVIDRGNVRIYIPVATSLLVSVLLSVVLWFLGR